ncbi:hypothetical protein MMC13_001155 [Lambiella insularis]|nr:hypothetical protein [Lambiella insularis]
MVPSTPTPPQKPFSLISSHADTACASIVLPLANSPAGHRLGVNGLAVDSERSILYSGGRDGVICAWDLRFDLKTGASSTSNPFSSPEDPPITSDSTKPRTSFRNQVQAHTHWVNDIILTQSNTALVSASSDITVKVWRPHSEDGQSATTIGLHSDYVKCLATPGPQSDWVASGGLDHKIRLWDLNGGGEKLQIAAGEDESSAKGSVYALSVRGSIIASGGPESIVRLWDPKSGKRITKFVGHTDNIRDILINQNGDTIMTASSDQTIKVWSMAAGRCMHTLTMHNDSVWSLYSDHPQLSVFYSSDRSGLVAKTDVRGNSDMDEGISVAVAQEHEGVDKVVVAGDYLWTATSSSSINRWMDVDTEAEVQTPESPRQQRIASLATVEKVPSPPFTGKARNKTDIGNKIPFASVLRISNTAPFTISKVRDAEVATVYSVMGARKLSEAVVESDVGIVYPVHSLPEETIEGQNGLIKHVMLNDRKRVLTLDTAGEVMLWDLLKGVPVQSFGKRHLEDVTPEVNSMESVANWCGVDTRTGWLAIILEENNCFDAEMYADEVTLPEHTSFREDQRINLGKWVLRYIFASLVEEEIKRDEAYRANVLMNHHKSGLRRDNAPMPIKLPTTQANGSQQNEDDRDAVTTPKPTNGFHYPAVTPGLSIGVATPGVLPASFSSAMQNHLPSTAEEANHLEKRRSHSSNPRTSGDYFSSVPPANQQAGSAKATENINGSEPQMEAIPQSPTEPEKDPKSGSLFGKKFRMSFPKKLGRSSVEVKPTVVDDKSEESDKGSEREDKIVEDNFFGIIQKIRHDYDEQLLANPSDTLPAGINPSLPNETPVLKPPPFTTVIIQEDRPDSGGVVDLYRGTVESVGRDANVIEKTAPMWLGDLLLRNQIPFKETVKVSFVLQPYQDLLPSIASADGNSRLNANRMLRAKKILAYVAERIEPQPEHAEPSALKPEEYLDLLCQDKVIPHTMTLATLRAHVWKTGGDVMLYYKSNGRKADLEKRLAEPVAEVAGVSSTNAV